MQASRIRIGRGRSRFGGSRPGQVWAALILGIIGFGVAVALLASVVGLIGGADGLTAGALQVPVGSSVLVVGLGYLITIALLVLCARSRTVVRAWVSVVVAVLVAVTVSVYPLVATASAAVDDARQIIPWIGGLIGQLTGR